VRGRPPPRPPTRLRPPRAARPGPPARPPPPPADRDRPLRPSGPAASGLASLREGRAQRHLVRGEPPRRARAGGAPPGPRGADDVRDLGAGRLLPGGVRGAAARLRPPPLAARDLGTPRRRPGCGRAPERRGPAAGRDARGRRLRGPGPADGGRGADVQRRLPPDRARLRGVRRPPHGRPRADAGCARLDNLAGGTIAWSWGDRAGYDG